MVRDPNWGWIDNARAEKSNLGENVLSAIIQNKMKQGQDRSTNADELQNAIALAKAKINLEQESRQNNIKNLQGVLGGGADNSGVNAGGMSDYTVDPNYIVAGGDKPLMLRPDIAAQKKMQESPAYQENKAKRLEELISMKEQNKVSRGMISQAQDSVKRIPTGLGGKMSMLWMKMFDSNNPTMEDWQNVKMVLTDAQLLNTAKTKGAISDEEMKLFSRAAANDDIASVSAMKPVFRKLVAFMDSEEKAKTETYNTLYGDQPAFTGGRVAQPAFTGGGANTNDDPLGLR
jgi:hypothetical protein